MLGFSGLVCLNLANNSSQSHNDLLTSCRKIFEVRNTEHSSVTAAQRPHELRSSDLRRNLSLTPMPITWGRVTRANAEKHWPVPPGGWCKDCQYDNDGFPIKPFCNVCTAAAAIMDAPLGKKRKVTATVKFDGTQESPKRKATPKGAPKQSATTKASATTKEPTEMTTMSPTVAIGAERLLVLAHGGTGVWETLGGVDRVDIHRNAKTVARIPWLYWYTSCRPIA